MAYPAGMRFSLSAKIFLGVALLVAAFGSVSLFSIYRMIQYQEEVKVLVRGLTPLSLEVREILRSTDSLIFTLNQREPKNIILVRNFVVYLEPFRRIEQLIDTTAQKQENLPLGSLDEVSAFLAEVRADLTQFTAADDFYRTAVRDDPSLMVMLEPLMSGDLSNRNVFGHVFNYYLDQLERTEAVLVPAHDVLEKLLLGVKRKLFRVQKDVHRFSDQLSDRIDRHETASLLTLIFMSIGAVLLGLAILVGTRLAFRPVRRLIEGVRRLSTGDWSGPIQVKASEEVALLAEEFNRLVQSLKERDRTLADQRERLLRNERLAVIGKMASFIAHEVRNPLNAIGLNAEMLEEDVQARGGEGEVRLLKAIVQEVDRLKDVTEQYLQFARPPAPERQEFPVGEIVDSFLDWQRPELESQGIELVREVDSTVTAPVDVSQVRQALVNLVANAGEALKEREVKRLTVGVRRGADGYAEVWVEDSGVGIPADVLARVTEPFFTTRRGGTGLGLPICQEIAERHGGELRIESQPGQGTRATLRFPGA
jgi:signal transduction histidine kinase